MNAALVLAALVLGGVSSAFLHRAATELGRAAIVVCSHETREWDPTRCRYVHRTRPAEQLSAVLLGPRPPRPTRRLPYVEGPRR